MVLSRTKQKKGLHSKLKIYKDFSSLAGVAQLVEQLTCNQQVAGSNPIASSRKEGFPSGQREQTVNLSTDVFGGSNPPPSTIHMYVL